MDLTAGLETARSLVASHLADLLMGSYGLALLALVLAFRALLGRRRFESRIAALQTTVTALERAEGRRIVKTISRTDREIA